ncbi:MAG: AAA family ATPase [Cyanobacteriota bacterium]|nr:AAA family ATPase [Cyanobacteriota bacterium]
MMKIAKIQIKNFKNFQDVTFEVDPDFNVVTGVNNCGKTNFLEAIALWHECFNKLIRPAGRSYQKLYKKGDFILVSTLEKYLPYETFKTVRSSNIEDIFYNCNPQKLIELILKFVKTGEPEGAETLEIGFCLKASRLNYVIELINYNRYDFHKFNQFFASFPAPISAYFASPVAVIKEYEKFLTRPQIIESIQKRASVEVIRNRLYSLYQNTGNLSLYEKFTRDLAYILFDNQQQIEFIIKSDIRQDVAAVINYKLNSQDTEKDLALLGSGTLQIIVILLNLYAAEQTADLNLILFDEPDSHIHRDIQKRLIEILTQFSNQNQIFLSTHNESLIRQTPLHQLFHLEFKPQHQYTALTSDKLTDVSPHFQGIYPLATNPVISSLGNTNGLDFINAVEADRIIFVEGADDAKAIYLLLQKAVIPQNTKKYVFWVLGGVDRIFKENTNITSYKVIFEQIKNNQTLWKKSVLIFDRDYIIDTDGLISGKNTNHVGAILDKFQSKLSLKAYTWSAYTLEAVLLTELEVLAKLLRKWLNSKGKSVNLTLLANKIQEVYSGDKLREHFEAKYLEDPLDKKSWLYQTSKQYKNLKQRTSALFGSEVIKVDDDDIKSMYEKYLEQCINSQEYYKIANKEDVEYFLNEVLAEFSTAFELERDWMALLECVDRGTWFKDWDFLRNV